MFQLTYEDEDETVHSLPEIKEKLGNPINDLVLNFVNLFYCNFYFSIFLQFIFIFSFVYLFRKEAVRILKM